MQNKTLHSSFKTIKYFIVLLTIASIYAGCKKGEDACEHVNCNGGTCVDGTCNCPPGYSGRNCENYDPCYNSNCKHGGTCVNGSCNCPTGYSGSDCGIALPLKSVTITKIVVNNFPSLRKDGQLAYNWDNGSAPGKYPDIYININDGTSSIAAQTSAIHSNISAPPQTYTFTAPITLNKPSNNYAIGLWDYDPNDPDQHMGGVSFKPTDFKTGYKPTIPLFNSTADYTVYVIWNF